MTVVTRTYWHPERLNASILAAVLPSTRIAEADANARLHEKRQSRWTVRPTSAQSAILVPDGLAAAFEHGRRGGYDIEPKKGTVLKIGKLGFAAYAVGGPMRSYPAAGPAARAWATVGFQATARETCSAAGFPPGRALV